MELFETPLEGLEKSELAELILRSSKIRLRPKDGSEDTVEDFIFTEKSDLMSLRKEMLQRIFNHHRQLFKQLQILEGDGESPKLVHKEATAGGGSLGFRSTSPVDIRPKSLDGATFESVSKDAIPGLIQAGAMDYSRQKKMQDNMKKLVTSSAPEFYGFRRAYVRYQTDGGQEHITRFMEEDALAGYCGRLCISSQQAREMESSELTKQIVKYHAVYNQNQVKNLFEINLGEVNDARGLERLMDQFQTVHQSLASQDYDGFPFSEAVAVLISKSPLQGRDRLTEFLGGRHNLPRDARTFTSLYYDWVRLEMHALTTGATTSGEIFGGANAVGGGGGRGAVRQRRYCFTCGFQTHHWGKECKSNTPAQKLVREPAGWVDKARPNRTIT